MQVIAIDPGERVGWANGLVHPDATPPALELKNQGVHGLKDFAMKLGKSVTNYDVVIYETWRLYPGMGKRMVGNDMQPSQLVGIIRYICWCNPQVKIVSQGADIKKTAMKTMPDHLRERMDRSTEQHDQDAIMHLWHYFWRKYIT